LKICFLTVKIKENLLRGDFVKKFYSCIILSFLLIFILSSVCDEAMAGAKRPFNNKRSVNAMSVIEGLEDAFKLIFENYQPADPGKDPFYVSLENAKNNVASLKDGMEKNDKNIPGLIGNITTSIADVRATYRYEKINNKNVEIGVTSLVTAWDAFSHHYVESLPRKNSTYTAEDAQQMNALKEKSKELDGKLSELEKKMSDSKELLNELKEMKEENRRIMEAHNDSAGLMASLTVFQSLMGWWNGFYRTSTFYYPSYVPYFVDCNDYWYCYDTVVVPAYNEYFVNVDTVEYWDTTWECDRPVFIDDSSYYVIDGRDSVVLDNSDPVFTDTLRDSGTFYIDDDNKVYENTTEYTEETTEYTEETIEYNED